MALGFAARGGGIKAATTAANAAAKMQNSSNSQTSTANRTSTNTSSSTSRPTSANGQQRYTGKNSFNNNTDWAQAFYDNQFTSDYGQLQNILDQRLDKLGGRPDDWQTSAQNWLNGQYNQQYDAGQRIADQYAAALESQMQQYEAMQRSLRQEQEAKVQANIADLNAQRPKVQQAGAQANQAAQQNYMNVLNPNGANAEQLAALGLTESGLSESAAISANNAYTQAVNSNEQNVSNQLAAIDLAITQAQLSGDIATAQQLQSYYNTVLNAGLQNAGNVLNANQWALTNGQNQNQIGIQNAFTQAGLTGQLNGQPTMAGQQLSYTIEGLDLQNQMQQYALLLQQTYGMDQAAAQLEAQRIANQGAQLGNAGAELANRYQQLYNEYQQIVNQGAQIANQGAQLSNQYQQIVNNRLQSGL